METPDTDTVKLTILNEDTLLWEMSLLNGKWWRTKNGMAWRFGLPKKTASNGREMMVPLMIIRGRFSKDFF